MRSRAATPSTLDRAKLRQLLRPIKDRLVRRWVERLIVNTHTNEWEERLAAAAGGGAKKERPAGTQRRRDR
jgi:hypothetical protein